MGGISFADWVDDGKKKSGKRNLRGGGWVLRETATGY
jgi:hypothetical protein